MHKLLLRAFLIVGVVVFIAILMGCQAQTGIGNSYEMLEDRAPSNPKALSYKEQNPKNLPLSRYGNRATYVVDGKSYDVLLTSEGYKECGIASWYGTKFHKKYTSSGDKYDMYQLTAAHKTLPLPTYVRVKNIENGESAVVKVNDRGPFHDNRVLDLSYAAARKLGVFKNGTAKVEVEAISVSTAPAHYYLQAGAFSSMKNAKSLKTQLQEYSSMPVFVNKDYNSYLVRVGPFVNRENTLEFDNLLKSKGINNAFAVIM